MLITLVWLSIATRMIRGQMDWSRVLAQQEGTWLPTSDTDEIEASLDVSVCILSFDKEEFKTFNK